jgi:hypothetical protein
VGQVFTFGAELGKCGLELLQSRCVVAHEGLLVQLGVSGVHAELGGPEGAAAAPAALKSPLRDRRAIFAGPVPPVLTTLSRLLMRWESFPVGCPGHRPPIIRKVMAGANRYG